MKAEVKALLNGGCSDRGGSGQATRLPSPHLPIPLSLTSPSPYLSPPHPPRVDSLQGET
ncbi:MAG: hypothetical protein F6K00_34375 [Leptolyngbya sp. SIOISBB]|nr:hypothetical protein [Leptolyngbya sp. SIOISBB]